jgi:hypothetical protein
VTKEKEKPVTAAKAEAKKERKPRAEKKEKAG